MDKKIAGLLGAVAAAAAVSGAHASTNAALGASSYGDLLKPIPNASALLRSDEAARTPTVTEKGVQVAEVVVVRHRRHYHHHHHHHHFFHRHHHHHHHHD